MVRVAIRYRRGAQVRRSGRRKSRWCFGGHSRSHRRSHDRRSFCPVLAFPHSSIARTHAPDCMLFDTEADRARCAICRDGRRDAGLVCVVEGHRDLMALEPKGRGTDLAGALLFATAAASRSSANAPALA